MRTTEQWWKEVSADPAKMVEWLKAQYHGEVTAEKRIRDLIPQYGICGKKADLLNKIADDEGRHALWVKGLLDSRGIPAEALQKEERYWGQTLPTSPVTFEAICAVGYHAEVMRLDRIELLAADMRFADIAEVFTRILPDEQFHAKAFGSLSTPEDIEAARQGHADGLNALGLVA